VETLEPGVDAEDEMRAEAEAKLLAAFKDRLAAHGRRMSDAAALAFLRKQKPLLVRAAFAGPPGTDATRIAAIAKATVLDAAAANAPMPRTAVKPAPWSPGQPYPRQADRKTLAAIISHEFFPVWPRSLERWPLRVRRLNGRAVYVVKDVLAVAEAMMAAGRVYKQG
jgi:hypothetical protein